MDHTSITLEMLPSQTIGMEIAAPRLTHAIQGLVLHMVEIVVSDLEVPDTRASKIGEVQDLANESILTSGHGDCAGDADLQITLLGTGSARRHWTLPKQSLYVITGQIPTKPVCWRRNYSRCLDQHPIIGTQHLSHRSSDILIKPSSATRHKT